MSAVPSTPAALAAEIKRLVQKSDIRADPGGAWRALNAAINREVDQLAALASQAREAADPVTEALRLPKATRARIDAAADAMSLVMHCVNLYGYTQLIERALAGLRAIQANDTMTLEASEVPAKFIDTNDALRKFLDAAGGEGLVLGGIDAGDLYCAIYIDNAAPPAPAGVARVPLTESKIAEAVRPMYADETAASMGLADDIRTARAIERAHGIAPLPAASNGEKE